jgi:hypothetical protein
MILLESLLKEVSHWTAIKKDSGKVVYFMSKQNKDAAIKKGTHIDPNQNKKVKKNKKTTAKKPVGKPIAPSGFRANKKEVPIESPNVNVISKSIGNIDNLYKHMVSRWADKKEKNFVIRTLHFRLKNKYESFLLKQAYEVNQVWNYVQQYNLELLKREGKFSDRKDLHAMTVGVCNQKELGDAAFSLHSQTVLN